MKITVSGKELILPEKFMWILFRHGEKKDLSRRSLLTQLGRRQVWSTASALLYRLGEDKIKNARYLSSRFSRAQQTAWISLSAFGLGPYEYNLFPKLEWGPDDGNKNDEPVIKKLASYKTKIVFAFGHNGLFENIAEIIHPREGGYEIRPAEAFIMTPKGVEVISPQV